ncbi:MAG: tetraacyldisaccharide 4'-kinase [Fretibacterium sp.]|nr:tetraacyldisaccharide 4'-kinase [Fretibacterium sp.]
MNFWRRSVARVEKSYMDHVRGVRRTLLWAFFAPLGWANRGVVAILDFCYRHGLRRVQEPPLPVVSVGNLSYGGTNKTPFVEMLCREMRARGVKVGIVSRGYGGSRKGRTGDEGVLILRRGEGDRAEAGDEPLLLSSRLPDVPVAVARDRALGVRALRAEGAELVVADDAFQHRRMLRDVDVVLVDASCPFGNGGLLPYGTLREPVSALARSHLTVLTKVEQAAPESLDTLRRTVELFVPEDRVFCARLAVQGWSLWDGESLFPAAPAGEGLDVQGVRVFAFSAIGNPESFARSLRAEGVEVAGERRFKDHHRYDEAELAALSLRAIEVGAEFLSCTEKDLYNLPPSWRPPLPLLVPRVETVLEDEERFFRALTALLRPRLVVASNGHGEDAIGALLAEKLRRSFPEADVTAFPLVGRGDAYRTEGFSVSSTPSVTPSGGVLKYHLRDLWADLRAGLLRHIHSQLGAWRRLAGTVRTPVCVGDVYLLLHTLWGCGTAPLFVATAKTVYLSGHWRLERSLIRRGARCVWTRDPESADQLRRSGATVRFEGSPIMDLLGDAPTTQPPEPPASGETVRVLLLPGSRLRAYSDAGLLLGAAELLASRRPCSFLMVLAPTLELGQLAASCPGWVLEGEDETVSAALTKGDVRVELSLAPVSEAAVGSKLLLGLGGTANQLCAGLGIPVVSIDEKGKRVQKKLLEDAELLVEPTPEALADCAASVLDDPENFSRMSAAGLRRMGGRGALDGVVAYAESELGWGERCSVFRRLSS